MPSIFTLTPNILHHLLSRLMYKATRCSWRPWKNALIRLFIHKYNVDMSLAEKSSAHEFETFNDFFTRSLKPGIRPIAPASDGLVSPVDASISALGKINDNRIFQAKGKTYSLEELLNGAGEYIRALSERQLHHPVSLPPGLPSNTYPRRRRTAGYDIYPRPIIFSQSGND